MDNEEYEDIVSYLLSNGEVTPPRLIGRRNKDKRRTFKEKCTHYELIPNAASCDPDTRCLLRKTKSGSRFVLRKKDLDKTWDHFHLDPVAGGHNGLHTMRLTIQRQYYMPKMREWLEEKKKECNTCRQTTVPVVPAPTAAELPSAPNLMWQMDYIGPFPVDNKTGSRYGLVVIDCHSKLTMFMHHRNQCHQLVWAFLQSLFPTYGMPKVIKSDNGGPFVALRKTLQQSGIVLKNGLPGNPRAQGQVERANATLKVGAARTVLDNLVRVASEDGLDSVSVDMARDNWVQAMMDRVENMNNTPKQGTRLTPMEMHFPRQRFTTPGSQHERFFLSKEDKQCAVETIVLPCGRESGQEIESLDGDVVERLINDYVTEKNTARAMKYLGKAAKKMPFKKTEKIEVGDCVLVRPSLLKKNKKTLSEPYFPYYAKVISVHQRGTQFRLEWKKPCPVQESPGQIARKQYRRDQLLVIKEGDDIAAMLINQNYLRANSRSAGADTYEVECILKEVLREDERGLQVMVLWKNYTIPTWESVSLLSHTDVYKRFATENAFIREDEQRKLQEQEEASGLYTLERILDVQGDSCFVLWRYFDDPTWEPLHEFEHIDNFKKIVRECRQSKKIRSEEEDGEGFMIVEEQKQREKHTKVHKKMGEEEEEEEEKEEGEEEEEEEKEIEEEEEEEQLEDYEDAVKAREKGKEPERCRSAMSAWRTSIHTSERARKLMDIRRKGSGTIPVSSASATGMRIWNDEDVVLNVPLGRKRKRVPDDSGRQC